jgi:hypothetical protein
MSEEPSRPTSRPRTRIKKVAPRTRTKQVDQVDGKDFSEIEIENLIKKVRSFEGLRLHRSRLGGAVDSLPDSARALTIIRWMDNGKLQPLAAAIRNHLFSQFKGLKGPEHELHPAILFRLVEMIESGQLVKVRKRGGQYKPGIIARNELAFDLYEYGDKSEEEIADMFGVSKDTVHTAIINERKRHRRKAPKTTA